MSAFGYPGFLWLLILVAALGGVFFFSVRKMDRIRHAFSSPEMMPRLGLGNGSRKFTARSALIVISAVLAVFALARPLGPPAKGAEVPVSMDVIIALDISDSMGVQDGGRSTGFGTGGDGSRLIAAKEFIKSLVDSAPGDRFGLVLFSGNSIISCPATMDHDAFLTFLDDANMEKQDLPGTAIGDAVVAASTRFKKSELPRAVVIVSDGENTYGPEPSEAAKTAASNGMKVYTIGVGTEKGGKIPDSIDFFGQMTFKKDKQGRMVNSALDEGTLKSVASAGGGKYFYSLEPGSAGELAKELSPKAKRNTTQKFAGAEEYGPWFALGAAAALMAAMVI